MRFSRQEYQSGLPFLPPGDLPHPGIEARSPVSPALQMDSLPTKPFGKLQQIIFETSFLFTSSKEELLILCPVLNSLLSVTGLYYPELALSMGLATTSRFLPHPLPQLNMYCCLGLPLTGMWRAGMIHLAGHNLSSEPCRRFIWFPCFSHQGCPHLAISLIGAIFLGPASWLVRP